MTDLENLARIRNQDWYKALSSEHQRQAESSILEYGKEYAAECVRKSKGVIIKVHKLDLSPEEGFNMGATLSEAKSLPEQVKRIIFYRELEKYLAKSWSSLG